MKIHNFIISIAMWVAIVLAAQGLIKGVQWLGGVAEQHAEEVAP